MDMFEKIIDSVDKMSARVPEYITVTLKGQAKEAQPSRAGTYNLGPVFVNGKNHWIKDRGGSAIWYSSNGKKAGKNGRSNCWMIGNKKHLGTEICTIQSTDDAEGPHQASSWKYKNHSKTDMVFSISGDTNNLRWIEGETDSILLSATGFIMEVPLHQVFDIVAGKTAEGKDYGRVTLKVKVMKAISSDEFIIADASGSSKIETWRQGWRGFEHYQCQNKKNLQPSSYVQIRNVKVDLQERKLYLDVFSNVYIVKPFPMRVDPESLLRAEISSPKEKMDHLKRRESQKQEDSKSNNKTKGGCCFFCLCIFSFVISLFIFGAIPWTTEATWTSPHAGT